MSGAWRAQAQVYGVESQGSKRLGRCRATGKPMLLDDNPRLKSWRAELTEAMRAAAPPAPPGAPIAVRVTAYLRRPQGHYGSGRNAGTLRPTAPPYPAVKPDADKVLRAACDAGTGVWWRDDAHIVGVTVRKRYCADGEAERVVVRAREVRA